MCNSPKIFLHLDLVIALQKGEHGARIIKSGILFAILGLGLRFTLMLYYVKCYVK